MNKQIETLLESKYKKNNNVLDFINFNIKYPKGNITIIDTRNLNRSNSGLSMMKRYMHDLIVYLIQVEFSGKVTCAERVYNDKSRTNYSIESEDSNISESYWGLSLLKKGLEKHAYIVPVSKEYFTITKKDEIDSKNRKYTIDILKDEHHEIKIVRKRLNSDTNLDRVKAKLKSIYKECLELKSKVYIDINDNTTYLVIDKSITRVLDTSILVKTIKGVVNGKKVK